MNLSINGEEKLIVQEHEWERRLLYTSNNGNLMIANFSIKKIQPNISETGVPRRQILCCKLILGTQVNNISAMKTLLPKFNTCILPK